MSRRDSPRVVVIGAGVGGLAAAAALARAGLDVTVLEAHVYAGGCAGTFYHQGYRFDAGATLAGGFYPGGPMDLVAQAAGISSWPAQAGDPALDVLLSGGQTVTRWGSAEKRAQEHDRAFGEVGRRFFAWQERAADALWALALRLPQWPPQRPGDAVRLAGHGLGWLLEDLSRLRPSLVADAFRPVAAHLRDASPALRHFVDGQLLIASQATSARANALYGAAALDLPRRGVVHLAGGTGAIAESLVRAIRAAGGQVLFRQQVTRVRTERGQPAAVETRRGGSWPADLVVANLTPWNIRELLGDDAPAGLRRLGSLPADGWGAFMLYLGVDGAVVPKQASLHTQVIEREPLGEGNSVFVSLSPEWDTGRAPAGRRALTISTHTELASWWQLRQHDREQYEDRKQLYTLRMVRNAERALPGLADAAELVLPGTPVTFHRFTRRAQGWVGGFPQTSLTRAWGPRLAPRLWMVGDSVFPGQSIAAVAMGGLRVAGAILAEQGSGLRLAAPGLAGVPYLDTN